MNRELTLAMAAMENHVPPERLELSHPKILAPKASVSTYSTKGAGAWRGIPLLPIPDQDFGAQWYASLRDGG